MLYAKPQHFKHHELQLWTGSFIVQFSDFPKPAVGPVCSIRQLWVRTNLWLNSFIASLNGDNADIQSATQLAYLFGL